MLRDREKAFSATTRCWSDVPDLDIAIIAFALPGVNGAELARLAQSRRTDRVVTGYVDTEWLGEI
jgi:hypothetical protein